ncbi:unnamed protein product [Closterium sp. Yama58-4]|nr:unnamed protein product [Closterium sp. Yama58-4]
MTEGGNAKGGETVAVDAPHPAPPHAIPPNPTSPLSTAPHRTPPPQAAKAVYEQLVGDASTRCPLAHIQLMRFLRRAEGMEAARKAFLAARKAKECTFHVYVASAYMELCQNKESKLCHNKESKVSKGGREGKKRKKGKEGPGVLVPCVCGVCLYGAVAQQGELGDYRGHDEWMCLYRESTSECNRECSFHVYVASAYMELWHNKESKVSKMGTEARFARFLSRLNDGQAMRELLQGALASPSLPPQSAIMAQEGRRKALASVASPGGVAEPEVEVWREQQDLVDRFSYCGLLPCEASALPPNLEAGLAGPKATQARQRLGEDQVREAGQGGAERGEREAKEQETRSGTSAAGTAAGTAAAAAAAAEATTAQVAAGVKAEPQESAAAGAAAGAGGEGREKEERVSGRVKEEAEGGEESGAVASGADGSTAGAGGAKEGGEKGGAERGEQQQQREGTAGATGVKTHQFVASAAVEWKPGSGRKHGIAASSKLLEGLPRSLAHFVSQLPPPVPGPYPDVDFIMSLVIQAELPPEALAAKSGGLHRTTPPGLAPGAGGATPLAGSKRKEQEGAASFWHL